jgi:hypothetical protein
MNTTHAAFLVAAALAGCAIDPAPVDALAHARVTLVDASKASSGGIAPPELALAREKIALAERWMAAGDQRPARWLVEQAQVDAELAAMKGESARAHAIAAQLTRDFRARNAALLLTASRAGP